MRVSIVSINYAPEPVGIAVYSTGLAEYLASRGHAVRVHTTFPWYPAWRKEPGDRARLWRMTTERGVSVLRTWHHVPRRPGTWSRMLQEASFVLSALLGCGLSPATDLVILVLPPLLLGLPLAAMSRWRGSVVVIHVQDLQPDAALALGLLQPSLFVRALLSIERCTYRLGDRVASIGEAMLERIGEKGVSAGRRVLLRNWATVPRAEPIVALARRGREGGFRQAWSLGDRFVVLYAGNLGRKQGADLLLDVAAIVNEHRTIAIVIAGEGNARDALVGSIGKRCLHNISVHPLVPADRLCELIDMADVAVIPQRAEVSDRVLPSKLANLLARGKPVIVASPPGSELARLIQQGPAGLVVPPGDAQALAAAIVRLHGDPAGRVRMANAALATAVRHFDRDTVLGAFAQRIESLVTGPGRPTSRRARARSRGSSAR